MKLFYRFAIAPITLATLSACQTVDHRLISHEYHEHPAYKQFVALESSINEESEFRETFNFFAPSERKSISESIGWARLVYSSAFKALKRGNCQFITIKPGANSALVDCHGEINHQSLLGNSVEDMHMRAIFKMQGDLWYLSRSGIVHTTSNKDRKVLKKEGIQFKNNWEPLK